MSHKYIGREQEKAPKIEGMATGIKTFNEYLSETTLARVWQYFGTTTYPAAIMSASKGGLSAKMNADRTMALARLVRGAGFGYVFVDGKYDGESETSLVINGDAKDNGKLKGAMRHWRALFDQQSVLFKPEGSERALLLYADREEDLGTFHPDRLAKAMTQLRGRGDRTFVFESAYTPMGFFERIGYELWKRRQ
jgi:hypothetical protein